MNRCAFQKAIRAESSSCQKKAGGRGAVPFLTCGQSDLFWDLTPWGKLNHKATLEYLHFDLCQTPSPLLAPQPHHPVYSLMQLARWKQEGMPFSHHSSSRGSVNGTYPHHFGLQRGHENWRNWKITAEWSESTEHDPCGEFTTMRLMMAVQPKEIWFKL